VAKQTEQRLKALFVQSGQPKPILLLGAGASVRSGLPLTDQIQLERQRNPFVLGSVYQTLNGTSY
jgi:hypothetical protein